MNPEQEIYGQLALAAERAYCRGIQTGNGGNISARLGENTMIVKSSGGSFADCDATGRGFVCTDFAGSVLPGQSAKPTREVYLHGLIYQVCSWAGGVVHAHSPWSIAWASLGKSLPMVTLHMELKIGREIPVVDIPTPSVQPEHKSMIELLFAQHSKLPAFILARHGVVALGSTVLEAEHNAELIEETAMIAVLERLLGTN